jgi:hypothetical protein
MPTLQFRICAVLLLVCACGCMTCLTHVDDNNPHEAYQGTKMDVRTIGEIVSTDDHVAYKCFAIPLLAIDALPSACLDTLVYPLDAYARKDRASRGLPSTFETWTNYVSQPQK